jgi:hypothetical protein
LIYDGLWRDYQHLRTAQERETQLNIIHTHRMNCPVCRAEMEWAASRPANPDVKIEEMEATK